jgi:hypothetical protein
MKKPDRIERAIEKELARQTHWASNIGYYLPRSRIDTLLRREAAYQRARVRKIVKNQPRYILDRTKRPQQVVKDDCGPYIFRYDLLAALKGRVTR